MASAASSLASRMRSISWLVLMERAWLRSGVASTTSPQNFVSAVPGAELRRPRIALVVALEIENVLCPRVTFGVGLLWFKGNQRGLALAGKNNRVIALHAPVVGEIENVVGRATDQGGEILFCHQSADAIEF